jgi:mRNA interferase MazF
VVVVTHGSIYWAELESEKGRPFLVLTRDRAIPVLRTVLVAPVTRTMRGIATEVALGEAEGLRYKCAATIDNLKSVPKAAFTRQLGALAAGRWPEVCAAMRAAIDC